MHTEFVRKIAFVFEAIGNHFEQAATTVNNEVEKRFLATLAYSANEFDVRDVIMHRADLFNWVDAGASAKLSFSA
jgi:hypothetical protein